MAETTQISSSTWLDCNIARLLWLPRARRPNLPDTPAGGSDCALFAICAAPRPRLFGRDSRWALCESNEKVDNVPFAENIGPPANNLYLLYGSRSFGRRVLPREHLPRRLDR